MLQYPAVWPGIQHGLFEWLERLLRCGGNQADQITPLLVIAGVCKRTLTSAVLFGIMSKRITSAQNVLTLFRDISHMSSSAADPAELLKTAVSCVSPFLTITDNVKAVVRGLQETLKDLHTFPCGIAVPVLECLSCSGTIDQLFKG